MAWCLGLLAVAFIQAPGRIVTDTKLDLSVNPLGFLVRSLDLWDDNGAFGQLQNQAYGYLFPMGPFFAAGDLLGLPPWATQRLWWGVLFIVAFLGVVKLCGVLGVGTGWTRILAGLLFALSPRFLSVVGPSSIEVWPSAVAPWVLVPLAIGLRRDDPRRMAAWSAVAVACVGGVNAAATFAVVPLAVLWIVLAPPGPRRRTMLRWWPPLVFLGTMWWIVPLFLLGRYSPPFLDYIESADNTTFAATAFDALRGTSNWVPYVDLNSDAGNRLLSEPLLIANGTVLLCFSLIGLVRRDLPHRAFLVTGLLSGLVLVTLGHRGVVHGFGAESFQSLLDGVLAPLRNTHKFDVMVRLPMVIAFCHAVTVLTRRSGTALGAPRRRDATVLGTAVLVCAAAAGATVPAWNAQVANRASFSDVPGYWKDVATYLADSGASTTLLTPATPFGDYVWGKTGDEPLQALASSPWAVRNLIPLAPGGNIEMLDSISNTFATGRGDAGFATFLRRAGIGTVVVRHDINRAQDVVPPELVRSTLTSTPGMHKVEEFGPDVGGGPTLEDSLGRDVFVDNGWQTPRPALEVFRLDGVMSERTSQPLEATPVLVGDSDALLALDRSGPTAGRSVLMSKDADRSRPYGEVILTDGNRRQEVAFGAVNHQRSGSLTRQEPWSAERPVHRYDDRDLRRWTTTPELRGARAIASSSSAADVGAVPHIDQSAQTWSAFDGDPETAWRPDQGAAARQAWVELDLGRRVDVGSVSIELDLSPGQSQTLRVTTERGPRSVRVQGPAPAQIDVGRISRLRVSGPSTTRQPLVVEDVVLERVPLSRPLVLPKIPEAWGTPDRVQMSSGPHYDDGCLPFDGVLRCSTKYFSRGDDGRFLDREMTMPHSRTYRGTLRVAPVGGSTLTTLEQQGRLASVSASSQLTLAAAAGPVAAIDGSETTGWIASPDDVGPSVTINWVGARPISKLKLVTSPTLAATTPANARLTFGNGASLDVPIEDGIVEFPRVRTDSVHIQLSGGDPTYSVDYDGGTSRLPIGLSEITVPGVRGLPILLPDTPRRYPCGSGPDVTVNGTVKRTAVQASPRDLAVGAVIDARLCGGARIALDAGVNRIAVAGTGAFRPVALSLDPLTTASTASATRSGPQLVTTTHNSNPGWKAGAGATPAIVNGWQQGYIDKDSRGGGLQEHFEPETSYRIALGAGGLLLIALLGLACRQPRAARIVLPLADSRSVPGWLLAAAGVVASGLIGGWWGLVALVVGAAPVMLCRRHAELLAAVVATGSVAAAGLIYVTRPWAGFETWAGEQAAPQLLVLLAVGSVAAVGLPGVDRRLAYFRRKNGSSTSR